IQKVHVNNATSGTYKLWFDANKDGVKVAAEETDPIDFNASAGTVKTRLENLASITTVNVSWSTAGNDRVYTVEFVSPGNDQAQLVGETVDNTGKPTLKGPAENGVLSGNATFDTKVFYNPAIAVVTTQQGVAPTGANPSGTDEQQTVTILNATGGKFKLSCNGAATSKLTYGDADSVVEAALEALPGIGLNNVSVSKSGDTYTVHFIGSLAHTNVASFTG